MSLAAAIALLSGICWGGGDFVGGRESRRIGATAVVVWSQLVSTAVLLALLLLLSDWAPTRDTVLWGTAGGMSGGIGIALFYRAMAVGAMSLVAPVAACSVAVPVAVSYALGERPSTLAAVGILAAVIGVVLVSLPSSNALHVRMTRHALALSLGAALGFAGFFVLVDQAAGTEVSAAVWSTVFVRAGSLSLMIPISVAVARGVPKLRGRLAPVTLAGVLDTTANGLYAVAASAGSLAVVSVLASLYPATTVLLARAFLQERIGRVQFLGVATTLLGVVLIAAG